MWRRKRIVLPFIVGRSIRFDSSIKQFYTFVYCASNLNNLYNRQVYYLMHTVIYILETRFISDLIHFDLFLRRPVESVKKVFFCLFCVPVFNWNHLHEVFFRERMKYFFTLEKKLKPQL